MPEPTRISTASGSSLKPGDSCTAEAGGAIVRPVFWLAFWFAALLVATKAAYLGFPEFSLQGIKAALGDLVVISSADVLFATVVAVAGNLMMLGSARRPALERNVWRLLLIFCVGCLAYAVVNVHVFGYVRSPLTYPLIVTSGDMQNLRSSAEHYVTPSAMAAMVALPAACLVLTWAAHRYIRLRRGRALFLARWIGAVLLVVYIVAGRAMYAGPWSNRGDHLIAANPHWTLFASTVAALVDGTEVRLDIEFPPEDLHDFRTSNERGGQTHATANLPRGLRNVILLVLESTGARYLDIYRGPYPGVTPRLKAEAENSLVFDNFYAHVGLSVNALVPISLGIYPPVTWKAYTAAYPRMRGTTIAALLRPLGYRTAFIENGDLDYGNARGFLENRGFDVRWDYRNLDCGAPDFSRFSWAVEDRCLMDKLLEWVDQDRGRPFFAVAWTGQAHHPYTLAPTEIDFSQGKFPPDHPLARYLNLLHEMDRQVGRLLDGLRERGLGDDTLVVMVGDHGEAFGDLHDSYGHGGRLYEENLRVPLMLWSPKLFRPGRRSDKVGAQVDLNATIADMLGILPADSWQGRSLFDPTHPGRIYSYVVRGDYLLGVRERNWKYIHNATTGHGLLFDLARDPDEQLNVVQEKPEISERLRQRLAAWLKSDELRRAELHGSNRR